MERLVEVVFWCAIGLLAYTYLGYPLLMSLLALLAPRPQRDPTYQPKVSILIAAYNEEDWIGWKVRQSLNEMDYPAGKLEVVVVSDGSTDRTDEILESIRDSRLRISRRPRGGKTSAQNFGVTQCTGDIVVFSDATAHFEPDAIRQLVAFFAGPRVGVVSGVCRFVEPEKAARSPTGLGQVLYGGYEQAIRIFQSRVWTATACSGPIYAVCRDLYVPLPPDACSDMVEPIEIVRRGYRVQYAPGAIAYEGTTRSIEDEFRMRVRVVSQGILGLVSARELLWFGKHPWIAFQLISHKLLRYTTPLLLALIFAGSAALLPFRSWGPYVFGLQLAFYAVALASSRARLHTRGKLLGLPGHFCTLNAAIVCGAWEVARGNRFAAWETARK